MSSTHVVHVQCPVQYQTYMHSLSMFSITGCGNSGAFDEESSDDMCSYSIIAESKTRSNNNTMMITIPAYEPSLAAENPPLGDSAQIVATGSELIYTTAPHGNYFPVAYKHVGVFLFFQGLMLKFLEVRKDFCTN